jgi:5'-3' exonuclease
VTIVSGDSDMIQVAQEFEVKLFHPIKDKYVEIPKDYDYCLYKAIKGDTADVIEGVYGYGEVKSERLAREAYKTGKLALNEDQKKIVSENLKIISIANNPNLNNAKVEIDKIKDARNNLDFQKIKKFYFDHKVRSLLETFDSVMSIFE